MRWVIDEVFLQERDACNLKFTCEDCALFDVRGDGCAHGLPSQEHRLADFRDTGATLSFCKEFELR